MHRVIFFKFRIHLSVFIFLVYLTIFPQSAHTEIFNVTNEDELREALSTAESNVEDDIVNIASGTYSTNGETFIFESNEDFSLTIVGNGAGRTILDGGGMDRVLEINSVSDAAVLTSLSGLTIQNGFHASIPDDPSKSDGGGIYVVSQNLTIEDCEFLSNSESRAGSGGGLFANVKTTINLSGNLFAQNSAAFSGGGAYLSATELNISDNQFYSNSAIGDGGGAYIYNFNVVAASITDNIFNSNVSSANGGGLGALACCFNINYVITNNTFTLNTADESGGGISFSATQGFLEPPDIQSFVLDLYNNIIFGNFTPGNGDDLFIVENSTVGPFLNISLFNNDYSELVAICENPNRPCSSSIDNQANNIDEDPLFVDAEVGDASLQPDSPCIDTGDPDAPDLPETDIFGSPRGPIPDMGAVEYIAEVANNGGCSLTYAPATSSLAVFLSIPVLILIRRILKRSRD